MAKQAIPTEKAPRPSAAYSQALRVGDFIFVAGQGAIDHDTRKVVGETIEEQTARTPDNIKAILEAAGASMPDVVKSTVHLSDLSLLQRFNAVYADYFLDPKPVRTTLGSQLLGMLVEIDVIAHTDHQSIE